MVEETDTTKQYKNKRKRRLNKFTMKEISIVGTPAQEPAVIAISKSMHEENQMNEEEIRKQKEQMAALEATVATQTATIEKLAKVNGMPTDVRAYYTGLEEPAQDTFLQKSATLQAAEVQNAQLANAVIHTDRNGVEYRKDDDPRLVQMAKDADEQDKAIKKMQKDNTDLSLQKMVDDFKFLPGDNDARTALVKAVHGIEDEKMRKASFEILKSKNKANGRMFQTDGTTAQGSAEIVKEVETEFDDLIKKDMAANPGITMEKAWDNVLQTPEGSAAYEKAEALRAAH